MRISREAKAGFVVLVTLISFYALYNFIKGKNLFTSGDTYYAVYSDVNGLAPSKPVSVNGLKVGAVDDIKLIAGGDSIYFVVGLKMNRKFDFSKETMAEIWEPGFMSGAEIRLIPNYKGQTVKSGDTIRSSIKGSMVDDITQKLEPTQHKLDSLMISFQSTLGNVDKVLDDENQENLRNVLRDLDKTINNFAQTSNSITKTSESANQLINDNSAQVKNTLNSTEEAMSKFGAVADKLDNLELEKISKNLEEVSEKLKTTLDNVNSSEGTLGALLNDKELYDNLNSTSKSLDALMEDFKNNPNKYVQFSIFGKKQKSTKAD